MSAPVLNRVQIFDILDTYTNKNRKDVGKESEESCKVLFTALLSSMLLLGGLIIFRVLKVFVDDSSIIIYFVASYATVARDNH